MTDGHIYGTRRLGFGILATTDVYTITLILSDAVGAVYTAGTVAAAVERLPVRIAGGLLIGTTLCPLAARMPGSRRRHFFVWSSLVYLSTVGVIVEGRAFAPNLVPLATIPWDLVSQAVVAAVVAASLAFIYVSEIIRGATIPNLPDGRRLFLGLLAGTVTYAVLYFVIGALNYALVTGPYYEQSVEGLINPPLQVVLVVFLFRGALLSVSLIPLVRTLENPRRRAWMAALSVVVLAGFLPLLTQFGRLPLIVLVASSYEIVLQVCPTAVVVAAVLGKSASPSLRIEVRRMLSERPSG